MKIFSSAALGAIFVFSSTVPGASAVAPRSSNVLVPRLRVQSAARVRAVRSRTTSGPNCTRNGGSSFVGDPGQMNVAGGYASSVTGGTSNVVCEEASGIVGGQGNTILTDSNPAVDDSMIGAGQNNTTDAPNAFIGAGYGNSVTGADAFVGSGMNNIAEGEGSFIGAGGTAVYGSSNIVSGQDSFIGAGDANSLAAPLSFIGAGQSNTIASTAMYSAIVAGQGNAVSGEYAAILGGLTNAASGQASSILGGADNVASGDYSAVGGGYGNTASGEYAFVAGGNGNRAAGSASFAGGYHASALHPGGFVWSDYVAGSQTVSDTANNQFVVRASGGVYVYSNEAMTSGVELLPGSGTWASLSDRNSKTAIAPLDERSVLAKVTAMPMSSWRYRSEAGVRHIGPMAQDFFAAFGVGPDDRHITSIDEDGVALAAVKALSNDAQRKDAEYRANRDEITALRREVRAIRSALERK